MGDEGSPTAVLPSHVIMGPGSKPSSQAHSKPPTTLVQVPFPQGLPMEHSSVSEGSQDHVKRMSYIQKTQAEHSKGPNKVRSQA